MKKNVNCLFIAIPILLCTTIRANDPTPSPTHSTFNRSWFDREIRSLETAFADLPRMQHPDKAYFTKVENILMQRSQNLFEQQSIIDIAKNYNILTVYETDVFEQDIENKKIQNSAMAILIKKLQDKKND